MSSFRDLYEHFKAIIATVTEVKHFDYWHNNTIDTNGARPFPKPAVFFEFLPFEPDVNTYRGGYEDCTDKFPPQRVFANVSIHVVMDKKASVEIDYDEVLHMDLVETIHRAINYTTLGKISGAIELSETNRSQPDTSLMDWELVYRCGLILAGQTNLISVNPDGDTTEPTYPIDIDITATYE